MVANLCFEGATSFKWIIPKKIQAVYRAVHAEENEPIREEVVVVEDGTTLRRLQDLVPVAPYRYSAGMPGLFYAFPGGRGVVALAAKWTWGAYVFGYLGFSGGTAAGCCGMPLPVGIGIGPDGMPPGLLSYPFPFRFFVPAGCMKNAGAFLYLGLCFWE